ncbi:hypothetical protein ACFUCQ_30605 [Streptomyces sp. NPDC057197]|uniref:hypothetical protein n=1 Tax=unclassified Streptomyces TaxID=2593676 RepID=UPI003641EC9B
MTGRAIDPDFVSIWKQRESWVNLALYARVEKMQECDRRARYKYTDISGRERYILLDKDTGAISAEGGVEDILYRAVAMKVASAWLRDGAAPGRLLVQS